MSTFQRFCTYNWGKMLGIAVGLICLVISSLEMSTFERLAANRPADIHESLWVSPQATMVEVLDFSAGQPTVKISLEQFKQEVGAKPYQLYVRQWWKEKGYTFSSGYYNPGIASVAYQAKVRKGDTDIYIVAYQPILFRKNQDNRWSYQTRFDASRNEFVSEATSLDDFHWYLSTGFYYAGWISFLLVLLRVGWVLIPKLRGRQPA